MTSRSEIVEHFRDLFLVSIPMFWGKGIVWDHFQEPQINLNVKNRLEGL